MEYINAQNLVPHAWFRRLSCIVALSSQVVKLHSQVVVVEVALSFFNELFMKYYYYYDVYDVMIMLLYDDVYDVMIMLLYDDVYDVMIMLLYDECIWCDEYDINND